MECVPSRKGIGRGWIADWTAHARVSMAPGGAYTIQLFMIVLVFGKFGGNLKQHDIGDDNRMTIAGDDNRDAGASK